MGAKVECLTASWLPQEGANRSLHRSDEEAALVRRAQASDQMACREIVERYQAKVFSVIRRILHNHSEAEDVAQEVFAKVLLSIRSFKWQGSLMSWIYRIAVNESYEYLRKRRARPLLYEADLRTEEDPARNTPSPARPIDATLAERDLVVKLLARLPDQERTLLLMKEVEGYSVEELSRMTGINANTVKVRLFRARQSLLRAAGPNRRALLHSRPSAVTA